VLVVGIVLTASIATGTRLLRNDNEQRLLDQRVNEIATVVGSAVGTVQVPLASAAALAEATNGDATTFQRLTAPSVASGNPFVSMSLWSARAENPQPIVVVGEQPKLARQTPERIKSILLRASRSTNVTFVNLLGPPERRLGYAISAPAPSTGLVAYAESVRATTRRAKVAKNSAFADFDYALYLGDQPLTPNLLGSSTGGEVPLRGRTASRVVPFGNQRILLVLAPRAELGGTLLLRLPWALIALGLSVTLAAAALVERLIRGRLRAEDLARQLEVVAAENARLLAEQRTVAYTLQHSLLPESLPDIDGLDLGVRYVAGVEGVDIGGDWYDVLPREHDLLFVVGDVSGRGLRAATIMAALRYAIHAYAAQDDSPTEILTKLSKLITISETEGFATVLCGTIDVATHRVTIASAGHLPPLLVTEGGAEFVGIATGVPVGVVRASPYESVSVTVPANSTLVVYTDGLVERRGESLDVGLERLRAAAVRSDGSLEAMLTGLVEDLAQTGSDDDTAVLGLRWRT
jgi:serine phosphatase RsbU (regulator of sigma subunit)